MMEKIKVKKLRAGATLPTYGTEFSAGADLYACLEEDVVIAPGQTRKIPTGLAMELPVGCAGLIYARSSLGTKRGLAPANKVGVVDSDYRGEFMIFLHNHGTEPQVISHGDRVAQLLITPVYTPGFVEAEELSDTVRGAGGFGSTGK
ncbi:MAG: dUTP diphosphatase [Ruminococcaceae bacterium]|nr:dUTP diphosphatase [Oscillospiraceae bacterium]